MAHKDFRCVAQNSVSIGGTSDIKAGLRRTEIRCLDPERTLSEAASWPAPLRPEAKDRTLGACYSPDRAPSHGPRMGGPDGHLASAARIHRRTRRRGGLAARGGGTAGRPRAANRRAHWALDENDPVT